MRIYRSVSGERGHHYKCETKIKNSYKIWYVFQFSWWNVGGEEEMTFMHHLVSRKKKLSKILMTTGFVKDLHGVGHSSASSALEKLQVST